MAFSIVKLSRDHSVRGLSLGDQQYTPLKIFLEKHAKSYEDSSLSRTYVACEDGDTKIRGYISIICGEIELHMDHEGEEVHFPYTHYPAIKISRLAVDRRLRELDIGRSLVNVAIGTATEIVCPSVGCRFVVVDAKKPSVDFYSKCGFTMIDTPENRAKTEPVMFMDLLKAVQAGDQPSA